MSDGRSPPLGWWPPSAIDGGGPVALDDTDRRLIELLVSDGRMATLELAEAVQLSGDAARERVKRLVDSGVISIVGSVGPSVVGLAVTGLAGLKVAGPAGSVAAQLVDLPCVDFVVATAGSFDVLIELVAPSHTEVRGLLDRHIRTIPEITSIETFLYLSLDKWTNLPGNGSTSSRPRRLDHDDRLIIDALRSDGRLSYKTLAAQTGINYATARRRMIALIDSGVVRITTNVNRTATGEHVGAAIGVSLNGPPASVIQTLREHAEISVIATCAGRFDLLLDVATTTTEALGNFVFDKVRNCEGVRTTETFAYLDVLKLPFSWVLPDATP